MKATYYDIANDYIKESIAGIKSSAKLKVYLHNEKHALEFVKERLQAGEIDKIFYRKKNTRPTRRQNYLSVIYHCNTKKKSHFSKDKTMLIIYVATRKTYFDGHPRKRKMRLKDYGIKWAIRKEDFVEVW